MKLSGDKKQSARKGHEMEKVSFNKRKSLYETSIDGLLDATLNGEREFIGVEFKARTSSATTQAEQIRMDDLQQID
eukprot:2541336-Ditylum_brightwellii.AAC.1